jgi:hypothetical protein
MNKENLPRFIQAICRMLDDFLTADETRQHCLRQPESERGNYMMMFAACLEWAVDSAIPQRSEVGRFTEAIEASFAANRWFAPEHFKAIRDSVNEGLDNMQPGPTTGVAIPIVEGMISANKAGCHLDFTKLLALTDMMYYSLVLQRVHDVIAAYV